MGVWARVKVTVFRDHKQFSFEEKAYFRAPRKKQAPENFSFPRAESVPRVMREADNNVEPGSVKD